MLFFVSCRGQNLILFQLIGDLLRASSLHAQIEDTLYNSGNFGVYDPVLGILRVLHIAVRDIDSQRNASFTLCFLHGSNFAAGVTGIKFISQPRIKNDGLCFDISDKIVVDVNIAFLVIVHGIAFADLNFLNQAHQRGTV